MNEIKLKHCPFCGGEAVFMTDKDYSCLCDVLRVRCSICKASARFFKADVYYCAAEGAAEVWNRRANDETVEAGLVKHGIWDKSGGDKYPFYTCSECTHYNCESTAYCPNCGVKMEGKYED